MRLFKRHPVRLGAFAAVVVVAELVLNAVPVFGAPASKVIVPVLACSLLFAALACDRGEAPRAAHLVAPFAAPLSAVGTIVLASVLVFGAEWLVAWQIDGVNLLAADALDDLRGSSFVAIYVSGVAVSLPLTLVPMLALFEGASARDAFAASAAAFFRNVGAFLLYGALSMALLGLAFVTWGLALLVALPLWAASSYAAWKDLYQIE
jgi:hypothetical protein